MPTMTIYNLENLPLMEPSRPEDALYLKLSDASNVTSDLIIAVQKSNLNSDRSDLSRYFPAVCAVSLQDFATAGVVLQWDINSRQVMNIGMSHPRSETIIDTVRTAHAKTYQEAVRMADLIPWSGTHERNSRYAFVDISEPCSLGNIEQVSEQCRLYNSMKGDKLDSLGIRGYSLIRHEIQPTRPDQAYLVMDMHNNLVIAIHNAAYHPTPLDIIR
ncbi:MAG: hypothetical protein HGA85_04370 [Nanoarchaeota archaeon]|nr:hypothetical protein [Nanoarchaeota archaeon]